MGREVRGGDDFFKTLMSIEWKDLSLQMEGAHQELSTMNKRPIIDKFLSIREKEKILNLSEVQKETVHIYRNGSRRNVLKIETK